eukprot:8915445-Ditylum_brightwellii.AAC.1
MMRNVHQHMFPLQAYTMQICYMHRNLIKPFKMSMHSFVTCVNKINKRLMQFSPRDDMTPQQKLADDKIMDILENAMSKTWQEEMQRKRFNCVLKGQEDFINFCETLESLDPLRTRKPRKKMQLQHLRQATATTNRS